MRQERALLRNNIETLNECNMQQDESDETTLVLQPLQTAIIAQKGEIIEAILQRISSQDATSDRVVSSDMQDESGPRILIKYLSYQSEFEFSSQETDKDKYDKEDRSLDGMNAFHLAAKYYPTGLEVIFKSLKNIIPH